MTTLVMNMPINNRTATWRLADDRAEWEQTRDRWHVFQGIRGALFGAAFLLLTIPRVWRRERRLSVSMPTPFESALLNLQLFDLRREPILREARAWFLSEFNPESFSELLTLVSGERNASFRMVLGYWDMAASLVTTGAVDADAFRAAHGEIFATFSKIHPFLAEIRDASAEPEFCTHLEAVVLAAPDAETVLARRREAAKAAANARRASRVPPTS